MTIQQAIDYLDEKKHNVYSREDKLFWLERLEKTILAATAHYEGSPYTEAADFSPAGDPEQALLLEAPWDQVYLRWLESQIDYAGQEYRKYNNSKAMFEAEWRAFLDHFSRSHRYRRTRRKFI